MDEDVYQQRKDKGRKQRADVARSLPDSELSRSAPSAHLTCFLRFNLYVSGAINSEIKNYAAPSVREFTIRKFVVRRKRKVNSRRTQLKFFVLK